MSMSEPKGERSGGAPNDVAEGGVNSTSGVFGDDSERAAPGSLRGWLSDVYVPALLEGAIGPLKQRLGPRATLDDPMFGRATGVAAIEGVLKNAASWMASGEATYERGAFTTGIDRDITEGTLKLSLDGRALSLPIAVVAERRRSREVELRVYFSTQVVTGKRAVRGPLVPPTSELPIPTLASDHLNAMRQGNLSGATACFTRDAVVRTANGAVHGAAEGGLRAFYERISKGALDMHRGGSADDGRTFALEYTITKVAGRDVTPQAGLMVFERSDDGLFRGVRMYDDIEEI